MQADDKTAVLKLKHGDDFRRLRLDDALGTSFDDLLRLVKERFGDSPFALKYTDEDGDNVSITRTEELAEALRWATAQGKPLVVHVIDAPAHHGRKQAPPKKAAGKKGHKRHHAKAPKPDPEAGSSSAAPEKLEDMAARVLESFLGGGEVSNEDLKKLAEQGCAMFGLGSPCEAFGDFKAKCDAERRGWHQRRRNPPTCGADPQLCTFARTGRSYAPHRQWFNCETCSLVGDEGCCAACAAKCHAGHRLHARGPSRGFYCDCGAGERGAKCCALGGEEAQECQQQDWTPEGLMAMSVRGLKSMLADLGIDFEDCVEKCHLVEKLLAFQSLLESAIAPQQQSESEDRKQKEKEDGRYSIPVRIHVQFQPRNEEEEETQEAPSEQQEEKANAHQEQEQQQSEEAPQPSEAKELPEEESKDEAAAPDDEVPEEKRQEEQQREPAQQEEVVASQPQAIEEQTEQQSEEEKPEVSPFKLLLQRLEDMGFNDRTRNIEALVKHRCNLNAAVADLLL